MVIRWNTAMLIFLGGLSTAIIIFTALEAIISKKRPSRLVIIAAIASFLTIFIAAIRLNEPLKVINLLARPTLPTSGALVSQLVLMFVSMYLFYRASRRPVTDIGNAKEYDTAVSIASIIIAIAALFCLFRINTLATRPALNTPITLIIIVCSILTLSLTLSLNIYGVKSEFTKITFIAITILATISVIMAVCFVLRLNGLNPADKTYRVTTILYGVHAPLFWSWLICSNLLPLCFAVYCLKKRKKRFLTLALIFSFIGYFILSLLLTQMPLIAKGINNRIFL
jgi:hypothetical protein